MVPGVEAPEDTPDADSPNILARVSSYLRCFASSSRCWRSLISSAVGCGFCSSSSSSRSSWTVSLSSPVTGSLVLTVFGGGLRLRSFICGLKSWVRGTLLEAATWNISGGVSLPTSVSACPCGPTPRKGDKGLDSRCLPYLTVELAVFGQALCLGLGLGRGGFLFLDSPVGLRLPVVLPRIGNFIVCHLGGACRAKILDEASECAIG